MSFSFSGPPPKALTAPERALCGARSANAVAANASVVTATETNSMPASGGAADSPRTAPSNENATGAGTANTAPSNRPPSGSTTTPPRSWRTLAASAGTNVVPTAPNRSMSRSARACIPWRGATKSGLGAEEGWRAGVARRNPMMRLRLACAAASS